MQKPSKLAQITQIRFAGFTGDWEQRKFGELAVRESNCDISSIDMPCVEYEDVIANEGQLNKDISLKEMQKKGIIFDGSQVLFGKLRPYLHNWLNPDFKGVAVGDWWVLRPIELDKNFLYRLIQTQQFDDIANQSAGSKMPRADWNLIAETEFIVPSLIEEQSKIGSYFQSLDKLISFHQSKFEKLQKIKKSCLQNLFPQNNQNTPKIRFKNFTDEWVENKLEKIANRFDNLRIPISADKRISGSIPYYGANGIQDYVKGYTHNGEFILIAEDGANDLKNYPVQYVNGKFWANNHTHVVQAIKEIANNKFLKYVISQINIERILVGGGRAKLNANAMMDLCFNILNLTEQEKIGAFFSKLDKLISLQQHKVEKLKNIKKALLNKMFI